jgi:hypothetical protein
MLLASPNQRKASEPVSLKQCKSSARKYRSTKQLLGAYHRQIHSDCVNLIESLLENHSLRDLASRTGYSNTYLCLLRHGQKMATIDVFESLIALAEGCRNERKRKSLSKP